MKKFYLGNTFDDDFLLYGMVAGERPHRVAWLINHSFGMDLQRKDDIVYLNKDTNENRYARFDYTDEINRLTYHLISNKDESQSLLPELKHVDYFILIKGALEYFKKKTFTSRVKHIEHVQLITEIDPQALKSKYNLIIPD